MQWSEALKKWGKEKTALRSPNQGCSCLISQQRMGKSCDVQIKLFPVVGGSLRLHLWAAWLGTPVAKPFLNVKFWKPEGGTQLPSWPAKRAFLASMLFVFHRVPHCVKLMVCDELCIQGAEKVCICAVLGEFINCGSWEMFWNVRCWYFVA